jgi:ElaB/YqjD/DUF883 family membrane-anchored ribosome-binding protein
MTSEEASELASEICDTIDEIDSVTKSRAEECGFDMEDIRARVADMDETITKTGRCSTKQEKALKNWKRGVSGWVH